MNPGQTQSFVANNEYVATPSDTELLNKAGIMDIIGAGDVVFIPLNSATDTPITRTFAADTRHPVIVKKILATGTTATPIHILSR